LNDKNTQLSKELEEKNSTINRLDGENQSLDREVQELKGDKLQLSKELDDTIINLQEVSDTLEPYEKLDEIYKKYMALNENYSTTIGELRGTIVCEDSPITFLYSISSNLKKFYDWIQNRLSKADVPVDTLADIYNWVLEQYCRCDSESYAILDVNVGDSFDIDKHYASGVNVKGEVKKVIVKGYYSLISEKIISKSIVEV
jgi:hypothetical protein